MWLALGGGQDSQGEVSSDAGRGQRWAGSWSHGPDASCSEERESHLGTEHALQPPGSRRARCRETKLNLQEPDLCWKVGSRGHTHCPPPPFTTAHLPPRESLAALTSSSQCRLSNKQSQQRQNAGVGGGAWPPLPAVLRAERAFCCCSDSLFLYFYYPKGPLSFTKIQCLCSAHWGHIEKTSPSPSPPPTRTVSAPR